MWRFLVAGLLALVTVVEGWAILTKNVLNSCRFLKELCDVNSARTRTNAGSALPRITNQLEIPVTVDASASQGAGASGNTLKISVADFVAVGESENTPLIIAS